MQKNDRRPEHLGWVQIALQAANPDLPHLRISAQVHYGPSDRIAFVDVFSVDADQIRRRQTRVDAGDLLRRLGYAVGIEPGRDVYDVAPDLPTSAHDRMRMLQMLHTTCDRKR